jgi:hypothetical protein
MTAEMLVGLHVKCIRSVCPILAQTAVSCEILIKMFNTKFQENPINGSWVL